MFINQKIKNFKHKFNLIFDTNEKIGFMKILSLMVIGTFLELCGIGLVIPLIKIFTDQEFLNSIYLRLNIQPLKFNLLLIVSICIFLLFFILKNFYLWIVLKKYSSFFSRHEANLQSKLLNGYLKNSVSFFKENDSSQIVNNIINISSFFSSVYLNAFTLLILDVLMQIFIFVLLLYFSWESTLFVFIFFGGLAFLLYSSNKKKLFLIGQTRNQFSEEQLSNLQETIGGIKEIKLTGRELFFLEKFKKTTYTLADMAYSSAIISGMPRLVIEVISVASIGSIILFLSFLGKGFTEILPIVGLFLAAAYKMIPSLNKILLMFNRLKLSNDAVNRIIFLLKEFEKYKKNELKKFNDRKKIEFNEIIVKNVSFKYEKRTHIVLENININFKKNSFTGITGESGSGKTTLIDLITGVINPTSGTISLDDTPMIKILDDWQHSIGYVDQNIFISNGSIKKNIAFGIPDEEIDLDLIKETVHKSSLDKFINGLKDGLDTKIGERGAMISGGQRQRIGIARALYNKPRVLIFDEATSALDLETENEILNEINKLKNQLTMISISHRANAIKYCDEVYNLINNKLIKKTK